MSEMEVRNTISSYTLMEIIEIIRISLCNFLVFVQDHTKGRIVSSCSYGCSGTGAHDSSLGIDKISQNELHTPLIKLINECDRSDSDFISPCHVGGYT